tara:strand:- start:1280 stop:1726 length:447 start_codon:yes stop_codon:yes gene_type:complete
MEAKMAKKKRNIGWQKYEDQLENQMSSPLMNTILTGFTKQLPKIENEYEQEVEYEDEEDDSDSGPLMLPMSQQLLEDISMLSNFECWVGHTNFDITPKVRNALDTIEGIELLKVCSRYRFFIGVGKMFDFKEVRKKIENNIINIERGD